MPAPSPALSRTRLDGRCSSMVRPLLLHVLDSSALHDQFGDRVLLRAVVRAFTAVARLFDTTERPVASAHYL